jgi:hypothetical protein
MTNSSSRGSASFHDRKVQDIIESSEKVFEVFTGGGTVFNCGVVI